MANSKKHKGVQASQGEILATPEVVERLLDESKSRDAKKKNKNPGKANKQLVFQEPDESERGESDDETECQKCKRLWCSYKGCSYKGKKSDVWLLCDICNSYSCPKCISKGANIDEEFFLTSSTH